MTSRLPGGWAARLRLPVIAAPMLAVSGPELVMSACASGVIGAFPTINARSPQELDEWVERMAGVSRDGAPYAANLIIRSPRFEADLEVLVRRRAEVVITSVGSPAAALKPLQEVGCRVFADVATLRHARRAVDVGVDGLVLLTAGSGGQTGWLNPFAFVRAVRSFHSGPLVLAGGLSDGASIAAAMTLGCDLGYMGTTFLATEESRADSGYKQMMVDSSMDDVILTRAFTGLPTSMLAPSLRRAGIDPAALDETVTPETASALFGGGSEGPRRWSELWSAGHSVSGVDAVLPVASIVDRLVGEYVSVAEHSGPANIVAPLS